MPGSGCGAAYGLRASRTHRRTKIAEHAPVETSNQNTAPSPSPHVVIIGGGFAGLSAARGLVGRGVRVTLIDRQNHHLFQPLLYQVSMAGLSPADIATPIRSVFRGKEEITVLLGDVTNVKLAEKLVVLADRTRIGYDYLIVAAGARPNYFGHDDDWAAHVLPLKSAQDAVNIRRRVLLSFEMAEREADARDRSRLLTFAVIGGGPTGVEVAGTLAELAHFVLAGDFRHITPEHTRVIVIEMKERLLPSFKPKLARAALRQLESLGVEVRLGQAVQRIDDRGVLVGGECIEAATVLWTAGVRTEKLAGKLGVSLDSTGRVPVRGDCSLADYPEVFVIGDMARFTPVGTEDPLPGLAPVAMQQGRYVARSIGARLAGERLDDFEYVDKGQLATVGRSRAVLQTKRLELAGFLAWLLWIVIHIWYLIGFRNRISVLLNWCWNYLTYRQGARIVLLEESLETLSRRAEANSSTDTREVEGQNRKSGAWPSADPLPFAERKRPTNN